MLALFAAHAEIQRIPAAVSEPPLGEIRLQWWREALDEILAGGAVRAHPVIEALSAAGAIDQLRRKQFEAALDARARLLYGDEFQDVGDLESWLSVAEAYLAPLVLGLQQNNARFYKFTCDAARAYHLSRLAPILAPVHVDDTRQRARQLYDGARKGVANISADLAPGILYISLTRGYLKRPHGAAWPLSKRLRLLMAMATGRI